MNLHFRTVPQAGALRQSYATLIVECNLSCLYEQFVQAKKNSFDMTAERQESIPGL